jgi:hypothetical protein
VVADSNPLPDRLVAPVHQDAVELALPDEKNIDQPSVVAVEVGKHTDIVKQFTADPMGLLYDDQQLLLRSVNVDQKSLELDQEIRFPLESVGDLEICGEDSINIQRFDAGISDESNLDVSGEGFSQLLQEDRFSRAHIPGQKNKALVLEDAIPKPRKAFPVLFAQP